MVVMQAFTTGKRWRGALPPGEGKPKYELEARPGWRDKQKMKEGMGPGIRPACPCSKEKGTPIIAYSSNE